MSELPKPDQWQPCNPDFRAVVAESFERQGLLRQLGANLAEVEPGRVAIELAKSDAVRQQQGYVHGAVIGAIGDSAGGYAALSLMQPASEVVTVEYKINFLAPARGARLVATGEVLRAGRSLTVAQVDVVSLDEGEEPVLVALLQATFSRVELAAR